jgi:molecular chaperone GrpE
MPQPKKEKPNVKELENLCMRLQADFENYKKRSQKEREDFSKYANTDLILQILPIIDNFQLATKHLPEDIADNNWVKGVLQIEKQLEQVLAAEGVTAIEAIGSQFDPYLHEAIEELPSERPEGEIIEEVTRGYRLNDKIIRHAKVKVANNN